MKCLNVKQIISIILKLLKNQHISYIVHSKKLLKHGIIFKENLTYTILIKISN